MKDTNIFVSEYIIEALEDILKNDAADNHCVILYKTKPRFNSFGDEAIVHKIYKNINEFTDKAVKDINEIDSSFGVRVQMWYFD